MSRKQLTINMGANIFSFLISTGISFVLSPFIINTVGKEAYGFVGLANNFVQYASLITVALNSMGGRFISLRIHQDDTEGANKYFNSLLIANFIMALIMMIPSAITVVLIDNIINVPAKILLDVQLLWAFIFIDFIINLFSSTLGVATYAKNRLDLASILSIKTNFIKVGILLTLFIIFKPSVWYIGFASVCCSIFTIFKNIKYTKMLLPKIKLDKRYFNFKAIIEVASAGIWNSFSRIANILSNGLDLLISNLFIGASAMGTLSISKTIPGMVLSISGILATTFSPNFMNFYAKGNMKELKEELIISMKFLGIVMSIPLSCFFVYGRLFYSLWVPNENSQLLYFLSLVAGVDLLLSTSVETLYNVFIITNKVKINSIFNFICSLLTTCIVFILINVVNSSVLKLFIIAGVSTVFGVIRNIIFIPIYSSKMLGFSKGTFYKPIIKNVIATLVLSIISYILLKLINIKSFVGLVVLVIITAILGLGINFFIILSKNEREVLVNRIISICNDRKCVTR